LAHVLRFYLLFLFTDASTPDIYTLSLHDALPILSRHSGKTVGFKVGSFKRMGLSIQADGLVQPSDDAVAPNVTLTIPASQLAELDRKSTRLNSSHVKISYAVFCLKKKK